jgi:pyruvate formate lyase activating enzyme
MEKLFQKSDDRLQCLLCPHLCKIIEGQTGICGVRKNDGTRIELITYGVISGYSLDPVEKKPLYHFFPGKKILSIGSYGCNMKFDFCQNYNEPVIWFEFVKETSKAVKDKGLYTVLVTNGYVNTDPLKALLEVTDAFNVDLKAFNNDFYKRLTGASLEPVKNTLKQIVRAGKHLEITTLLITGQNDNINEMEEQVRWIANELGQEIPFHLSRYFPMYKRDDPTTPQSTLLKNYEIASKHLSYVYLGNTFSDTGQNTICPECGTLITMRSGYHIEHINTGAGKCAECGKEIYKYFTFSS